MEQEARNRAAPTWAESVSELPREALVFPVGPLGRSAESVAPPQPHGVMHARTASLSEPVGFLLREVPARGDLWGREGAARARDGGGSGK